jgi:hypothetical protein
MLQIVASLMIVYYDHNMLMIQATDRQKLMTSLKEGDVMFVG